MRKFLLASCVSVIAFMAGASAQAQQIHMQAKPTQAVSHGAVGSATQAAPMQSHGKAHAGWGYSGEYRASQWGGTCSEGQAQSPINIARYLQEDLPDLGLEYQDSPLVVVNNGHTIEVKFELGSGFHIENVPFTLQQVHFHTPSEHYLDGAPYPMEMHFVHMAENGTLAVVAVMVKVGQHNNTIEGIWQNVPGEGQTNAVPMVKINAENLLPEGRDYYKYIGSLTTPPCSEDVIWHVLKEPVEISEKQLRAFQSVYPVNARPVQPVNGRMIIGD